MKLKKVELSGFKSFADRATVTFTAGLNGIVGPNGCGKSNITDAFRWVLGEQSTKALRASNMQEVIFHGSSKRKAVSMAEVTITFSNVDRFLPIDYQEVAITRRLYRSGESHYFLNKQPVRLRDVHDLFAHSGVGKEAFAIIEQGKVDTLVKESPLQRRVLFEEAAGIMRFLEKRGEALKKLQRAEEALQRVFDLVKEVDRQLIHLEKQVEEAKRFSEDKAELMQLELTQVKRRFEERERKSTRLQEKKKQLQEELVRYQEEIEAIEKSLHDQKETLIRLREHHFSSAEKLHELKTAREVMDHGIRAQQEALQRVQRRRAQLAEEKKKKETEHHTLMQQEVALTASIEKKAAELLQKEQAASVSGEALLTMQQELEKDELSLREAINKKYAQESELNRLEADIRAQTMKHEALKARLVERQKRLADIMRMLEQDEQALHLIISSKEKLAEENAVLRDLVAQDVKKREELDQKLQEAKIREEEERRKLVQSQARYSALQRMKEEMQGLSLGAKAVLKEAKKQTSPLYQKVAPLAEYLQAGDVEASWVDLFGRLYNSTLAVEKEEDIDHLLRYAKEQKLQELSFFCLAFLPPGVLLAEHLFAEALVKETLDDAKAVISEQAGRAVIISQGYYVDPRGVIFVGGGKESNLITQEKEIQSLQAEIKERESALKKMQESKEASVQARTACVQSLQEKETRLRQVERELYEKTFQHDRLMQALKERGAEKQKINQELEQIVGQETTLITTGEQEKNELSMRREKLADMQKMLQEQEAAVQRKKAACKQLSSENGSASAHVAAIRQEKIRLEYSKEAMLTRIQELKKYIDSCGDEAHGSASFEQECSIEIEEKKKKREQLAMQFQELKQKLEQEQASQHESERQFSDKEKAYHESTAKKQERAVKIAEVDSSVAGIGEQVSSLERELMERFSLTKEELFLKELISHSSDSEIERRSSELRAKMVGYAHVNLRSLEDFEESKERKRLLETEIHDVEESKRQLIACIEELEKESREQFVKTFSAIRESFCRNFSILFEGGQADLVCTETDDPLTCGIDLVAKPPGKELKSVHLLSGGEKCLTALALLFAIFDVRPAPFCILDEVDAPLDELNVDRFNKMIKRYSDRCQFLLITHNKRTMLHVDRLIGVSMQEKGVSQVLQLELARQDVEVASC